MKHILDFDEVKQTVNTPVVNAILANKENIKTPTVHGFMHERNLFLSIIKMS